MDWNSLCERMNIKTVKALDSREGYSREGIGRVLPGSVLLDLLDKIQGVED